MNNYYKSIYERTDIHAFSKRLESMICPTFFSKKKKYLYSFDKLKNCLYVKHNNCRNTLSPQIILYSVNDTTEITCKYTLKAYLILFLYIFSPFLIISIGLIDGCEITLNVIFSFGGFWGILFVFYAIVHKLFFVNEVLEFKKDFEKCTNLKEKETISCWNFFYSQLN
jgi:hypothetical protein